MKITLRDIASEAEVSVSTVSRVLNGESSISADRAAIVRGIAERLNYSSLRSRKRMAAAHPLAKKSIGVISLGMDRAQLSLPVVASAINGAEAALSEAGANVLLAHVTDLERIPPSLNQNSLDGLILHGTMYGREIACKRNDLLDRLRQLASVWIMGRPKGCWGDSVSVDDFALGAQAAEYLVARGHRQLAFLNPTPEHLLLMRREDGFVAQASRLGVAAACFCDAGSQSEPAGRDADKSAIREADKTTLQQASAASPCLTSASIEAVRRLVAQVLARRPRPTAIFAATDSVVALVYQALADHGLRAGHEISVISGNNDRPLIAALHPHLTTFDIHADLIGRLSVQQLAARLSDSSPGPDVELRIEPTLVEGASVTALEAPVVSPH